MIIKKKITVSINEDSILSLTLLSNELEICWYLDNDIQKCAYRRNGSDWIQFLAEDSCYRDSYGAELYDNLFGYSGFFIKAPRGAAYYAHDYYYFDLISSALYPRTLTNGSL